MTPKEIAEDCAVRFGPDQPIDLEPIYCIRCGREIDEADEDEGNYVSIDKGEWAHASCQQDFEDRHRKIYPATLHVILVEARGDAKCL